MPISAPPMRCTVAEQGSTSRPSLCGSLAPASPPSFKGDRQQRLLQAMGLARVGGYLRYIRSQKMTLSHVGSSQKKRLTRARIVTGTPCQGRSEIVRAYRLWTLPERPAHSGGRTEVATGSTKMVTPSHPTSRCSVRRPSRMRLTVARTRSSSLPDSLELQATPLQSKGDTSASFLAKIVWQQLG